MNASLLVSLGPIHPAHFVVADAHLCLLIVLHRTILFIVIIVR